MFKLIFYLVLITLTRYFKSFHSIPKIIEKNSTVIILWITLQKSNAATHTQLKAQLPSTMKECDSKFF